MLASEETPNLSEAGANGLATPMTGVVVDAGEAPKILVLTFGTFVEGVEPDTAAGIDENELTPNAELC